MADVDIEHIITLVSENPCTWDKTLEKYHNRIWGSHGSPTLPNIVFIAIKAYFSRVLFKLWKQNINFLIIIEEG